MVVAQLVERSLLTPEIPGSNRVIVNFYINYQLHQNDKKEKKRRSWPIIKNNHFVFGAHRTHRGSGRGALLLEHRLLVGQLCGLVLVGDAA